LDLKQSNQPIRIGQHHPIAFKRFFSSLKFKKYEKRPLDVDNYDGWKEADFAEDLRVNPRYQDYLKDFSQKSVAEFIKDLAREKYRLHKDKNSIYSSAEYRQSQFLTAAEDFLGVILQKKLFNVQCLWRANMIEIPKLTSVYDFKYFGSHIWDCPFIEPITEAGPFL
jgi:hypothetical protein